MLFNNKIIFIKNYIKNIVSKYVKYNKIQLGRWNIENCVIKTNIKIDSANYDHCGICTYNKIN